MGDLTQKQLNEGLLFENFINAYIRNTAESNNLFRNKRLLQVVWKNHRNIKNAIIKTNVPRSPEILKSNRR